jgi:hypothetical protein
MTPTLIHASTAPLIGCFFCGIDSKILILFVSFFVASMILATAAFFVWSIGKKGGSGESVKFSILENELEDMDPEHSPSGDRA